MGQERSDRYSTMSPKQQAATQLVGPDTVGWGEKLWKSISWDCSVKNYWFFMLAVTAAPLGTSPWRHSRPGCLCGDNVPPGQCPGGTLSRRAWEVSASGARNVKTEAQKLLLGWPTKTAACLQSSDLLLLFPILENWGQRWINGGLKKHIRPHKLQAVIN